MAWAKKLRRVFFPMISAAKMCALRAERDDLLIGQFDYPRSLLLAGDFPAVYAIFAENDFDRNSRLQFGDIAGVSPL